MDSISQNKFKNFSAEEVAGISFYLYLVFETVRWQENGPT